MADRDEAAQRAYDGFEGTPEERIRQLELENDILRGAVDLLKAGSLDGLTNAEKTRLIDKLRLETGRPLRELTDSLRISKSSYEYCRKALAAGDKYAGVRERVVAVFDGANGRRGYRYIHRKLAEEGAKVSEKVVRRLMSEEGCRVAYAKKAKRYSSYGGETSQAPPNLVGRDFRAGLPNFLWLVDITEFALPNGDKVYLNPVIDCFDGRPAAWRIGRRPDSSLVDGSLLDAISRREGWERTVVHGDRGVQNRSASFIAICEANGITRSMSAKGCSPDNSACEGFFGRLKNEFFYYTDWRGVTTEEFIARLDAYMRYYCEERPKESLGWMSPDQYRRSLGLAA